MLLVELEKTTCFIVFRASFEVYRLTTGEQSEKWWNQFASKDLFTREKIAKLFLHLGFPQRKGYRGRLSFLGSEIQI